MKCLHELVEDQVRRTPKKVAIQTSDNEFITYEQLNDKATSISLAIRGLRLKPGSAVPLAMTKSADLLITMLAVLKAGHSYVPMDPSWPILRFQSIFESLGAEIFIADETCKVLVSSPQRFSLDQLLASSRKEDFWSSPQSLSSLAYIIFTSGSTVSELWSDMLRGLIF
jgi:non-ribosomal peptide synthetase component F